MENEDKYGKKTERSQRIETNEKNKYALQTENIKGILQVQEEFELDSRTKDYG